MPLFGVTTAVEIGPHCMSDSTNFDSLFLTVTSSAGTPNVGAPTPYLKSLTRALSLI